MCVIIHEEKPFYEKNILSGCSCNEESKFVYNIIEKLSVFYPHPHFKIQNPKKFSLIL